jgi:hypothetical protein
MGHTMVQVVRCQLLVVEARLRSLAGLCEICGVESAIGTGFSPSTSAFPLNNIPPMLHIPLSITDTV